MSNNSLLAISPVDGRYKGKVADLSQYFSEFGLIRYRVFVEIQYFKALCAIPLPELSGIDSGKLKKLDEIYQDFNLVEAQQIKDIEATTNHDVKAVEYYLREKFDRVGLQEFKEFIHFGLTSQDINNTAIPLSIIDSVYKNIIPRLFDLVKLIRNKATEWKDIPMLARTHGQPASPTTLGKEFMVFVERLEEQLKLMQAVPVKAKFGGATGNFNAHYISYPDVDWHNFADDFINSIGMLRQQFTTQIEHYDFLAALFDNARRINNILIDFSRDIWAYNSLDYFKQTIKKNEVGSSAMPHKVNPIDFENAEGNLGIANALFDFLSNKLPVSRLQRDLTDSTVTRNIGIPFAHTVIAIASLEKGISKLLLNRQKIDADLEQNWAVVAEAIQTILRKLNYPNPYEALKALTRTNSKIGKKEIHEFIGSLEIPENVKETLLSVTPFNYTGKIRKF